MNVVLWRGDDAIERAALDWKQLEASSPPAGITPFQRLAWASAWHRTVGSGSEPWLFALGTPAASILPLTLVRRRGIRFLRFHGHGLSDYLGAVPLTAPPAHYRALGEAVARASRAYDVLDLQSFSAEDDCRAAFAAGLGRRTVERVYERCPIVDATEDWKSYLASRKKKFRANLKRAERRVAESGTPRAQRENLTPALFEELIAVERDSWKWKNGTAFTQDLPAREMLRAVLLEEPIPHELWTLRVGQALAGFAIVFLAGDVRYYYLPSFRERYPDSGTWLLAEVVRDTIEGSFDTFDFLRGDEAYKLAWAHRERSVHQMVAAGRTPLGAIAMSGLRLRWRLARSPRLRALRARLARAAGGSPARDDS